MSVLTDFLDKLTPRAATVKLTSDTGYSGVGAAGHNQDLFAPTEYGDYIATSNDVYSVSMLRAKSLAKLNLQYMDRSSAILEDGADTQALLQHVNPFWTFRRLLVQYQLSMGIWGQNYWVTSRSPSGKPTELWWVKPTHMRPIIHPTEYITGFVYQPPDGGEPMKLDPDEVIWIRYPNIIDQFTGLAPLAAARLAADSSSSAMHANQKLFDQGLMLGGAFMPASEESELSVQQAIDLEEQLDRRFRGVDKAHRWAVFRHAFKLEQMGVSPRDADFINGMNLSFRQVCRAFGVPSQLLNDGEFATLANLTVYERQLWEHTMEFEAAFLADELNEQLLPMFRSNPVKSVAFDLSKIAALQEDRTEKEQREMQQIKDGRITINEWRVANGYEEVAWGDVFWAPWNVAPIEDAEQPALDDGQTIDGTASARGVFDQGRDPYRVDENRLTRTIEGLLARQLDAVISTINARTVEDAASVPFDYDRWVRQYVDVAEPNIYATVTKAQRIGNEMIGSPLDLDDLAEGAARQAHEFTVEMARTTNRTLFDDLSTAISSALEEGLDTDGVTGAVRKVLGPDVAEWRARRVATTEVTKSTSWGQMETWRIAGVKSKRWITQSDASVRDTHAALHRTSIAIDDGFLVGGCIADAPGLSGCAEEDINCRCRLEPVGRRGSVVPSQLSTLRDALGGTK